MAVFAAFAWGLRHLAAGRAVYATGSDPEAARLAGIRPRRVIFGVFVAMGALAGLAALLNAVRLPDVDPNAGTGLELQVIAAVVVGGVAISGGRGTLAGHPDRRRAAGLDRPGPVLPRHQARVGEGHPGPDHPPGRRLGCPLPEGTLKMSMPTDHASAIRSRRRPTWPQRSSPAQAILAAILLLEVAVFSVIGTNFLTLGNAFEVLRLSVEIGLLAVALTPVITTAASTCRSAR